MFLLLLNHFAECLLDNSAPPIFLFCIVCVIHIFSLWILLQTFARTVEIGAKENASRSNSAKTRAGFPALRTHGRENSAQEKKRSASSSTGLIPSARALSNDIHPPHFARKEFKRHRRDKMDFAAFIP